MRVAIDARTVYAPARRGTGKTLVDLYATLAAIRPDWEFVMFHQCDLPDDPFAGLANVRRRRIDVRGDRINAWQDARLPLAVRAESADLLHCPANTAPWLPLTPTVVTIHDLIPLEAGSDAPEARRWRRRVGRSAVHARRIVTPSEYSRRRIVETFEVPLDKVTVNHWAPHPPCRRVQSADAVAAARKKFGIADGTAYVLAFGAIDPRKNTAGTIEAWRRMPPAVRDSARLLIVGVQAEALSGFGELARAGAPDGGIVVHGFVEETEMAALLTGAAALCYPSRSEGFGLPILEAFACGTPVIASGSTSLPEVAGDAALLVDPDDPAAIARALADVLSSADTRDRLRAAASRRLELFSWDRCASTMASVFESAVRH
jgi:glycosyltransferase involved in cell wall biosynthesis